MCVCLLILSTYNYTCCILPFRVHSCIRHGQDKFWNKEYPLVSPGDELKYPENEWSPLTDAFHQSDSFPDFNMIHIVAYFVTRTVNMPYQQETSSLWTNQPKIFSGVATFRALSQLQWMMFCTLNRSVFLKCEKTEFTSCRCQQELWKCCHSYS